MTSPHQILLLGAGELGSALLTPLQALPNTHITLAVRDPSKYTTLSNPKTALLALDNVQSSLADLAQTFKNYSTIISCTGFAQPLGTQTKLANAVLLAGKLKKEAGEKAGKGKLWYFPWQWGVDYNITRDAESTMPLFGEQLEVRNLLRAKAKEFNVAWTIVSTGIFMSFLFERFWGVVNVGEGGEKEVVVRALGGWENKVTVTTVEDIGRIAVAVVEARGGEVEVEDQVLYAAGETINYATLAELVEKVTGKEMKREAWSVEFLKDELAKDPENMLRKYRVVFAGGKGVWWKEEETVNRRLGMQVTDVETWARKNLKF